MEIFLLFTNVPLSFQFPLKSKFFSEKSALESYRLILEYCFVTFYVIISKSLNVSYFIYKMDIICETDRQSRFDAWDRVLRAGALGWPSGMGGGGRLGGGSGWGTHVHPWLIHANVWQNPLQYCKVISLQLK